MLDAGINVCFGHDDVLDPWYPLGSGNMLQVLQMGVHVCQLMGHQQLKNGWKLISENSARALCIGERHGIDVGKPAHCLILDASDGFDALRRQAVVRYSIRNGEIIARTEPSRSEIIWNGQPKTVSFHHSRG